MIVATIFKRYYKFFFLKRYEYITKHYLLHYFDNSCVPTLMFTGLSKKYDTSLQWNVFIVDIHVNFKWLSITY